MAIPVLLFSMSLVFLSRLVGSEPTQDRQALLAFLSETPHGGRVRWNDSASACEWVGVRCYPDRNSVYSLRLPGVGLVGEIPPGTIGRLSQLRVLSLRSNGLSGRIPSDFSNLTMLRSLYLQDNAFAGEFPPELTRLTRLVRLDISSNSFSGQIPFAINNLTHLTGLLLENNNFSGELPSISVSSLDRFNVSNNRLNGSIPASLSNFPPSAFAGNLALCDGPLEPCTPFSPSPSPSPRKKRNRLSRTAVIAIVVGCSLFVLLLLLLLLLLLCRKRWQRHPAKPPKPPAAAVGARSSAVAEAGTSSSKEDFTSGSVEAAEKNKLVFMGGPEAFGFDLEDLLRASAEVLGKGSGGTSYKAVLEEGTTVVVKRLREVAVGKREFGQHMEAVGKARHEHDNVVGLKAYYYSKDEKLLVFDYFPHGSLAALLHGSRGSGRAPLDWDNRLRIAIHTARGLAHLHTSAKLVHGNIKSSNVLLQLDGTAAVSDFGLNQLLGPNSTPSTRVVGYRAPEVTETRKVTFKSDVYSFGVLLLELLTGKAPSQALLGEEGIDLPRWVQSVVREEWTAEVFDVELMRGGDQEAEMVQVLQIAMACVAIVPDQRPRMLDVARMMEEVRRTRTEAEEGTRPVSDDPSKGSDGQTPTKEMKTPPRGSTS